MREWSDPAYAAVASLVNVRTGLVFRPSCCDAAEAGTRRAMERAGVTDVTTYIELLRVGEAAFADLIDELTVRETYFFRHPTRFDFIRHHVLPEIRRRRGSDHVVRVWSAGCASGEEAYSLAILLDQEGLSDRCSILATDISRVALRMAAEAAYGVSSLRGMQEDVIRRYFQRRGYRELLDERIRRHVTFCCSNLAADEDPGGGGPTRDMDIILCRNVLIYFDRDAVRQVARRLYDSLAEGGWLITGASDPPLAADAPLETVVAGQGVVYRRASRRPARSAEGRGDGRVPRLRWSGAEWAGVLAG